MQNNKRTLFKVGCGAVAASAIAAGVVFEVIQHDKLEQFGQSGKMSAQDYEFMAYVSTYGKNYPTLKEYKKRQANWVNTDAAIKAHNADPKTTSVSAHNKFSTLSSTEFQEYKGYNANQAPVTNDSWSGPQGPIPPPGPGGPGGPGGGPGGGGNDDCVNCTIHVYPNNDNGGGGEYPNNDNGGGGEYPNNDNGGGGEYPNNDNGGGGEYPNNDNGGGGSSGNSYEPINWVTRGKVSPIQNQGQCGGCWSFSASGNITSRRAIKYNSEPIDYSEQQLIDCSGSYGNNGCKGGIMDSAFEYVVTAPLETSTDYPYRAVQGSCMYSESQGTGAITGHTNVQADSVNAMKFALQSGPVSVAVDASQSAFQQYRSGVLSSYECGTSLDHGIMAVGWATDDETGQEYFLVKNQWGESWGDNGYLKIAATSSNACGILSEASYVVV